MIFCCEWQGLTSHEYMLLFLPGNDDWGLWSLHWASTNTVTRTYLVIDFPWTCMHPYELWFWENQFLFISLMEKVNIYHCIHLFSPQKRTFWMTAYFHTGYDFLFWQEICFQAKMCKDHEVHTSVFVEDYLSPKSNPKQLGKDISGVKQTINTAINM